MATCDPQELLASAACIDCLSPGLKETLKLQLLCEIANGAGDAGITELTGDVTAGPGTGSQSATIAAGAVTLAKMANLAANSVIGNSTGLSATPQALAAGSVGLAVLATTTQAAARAAIGAGTGSGSVTDVSVTTANGVSGSVATSTTTPAITLTLGAITPVSAAFSGTGGNGFVKLLTQASNPTAPASGFALFADASGRFSWRRASDGFTRTFELTATADRLFTIPDASFTFAGQNLANTFSAAQTFSSNATFSANGALSAPAVSFTGTPITGGTATTCKPMVLIETSGAASTGWSTSGTLLGVNAPSGFSGQPLWVGVNGSAGLTVSSSGNLTVGGATITVNSSGGTLNLSGDVFVRRNAAANIQLGATDAASPVAQTLSVQSVVAGTTDTAGANWTFTGSRGTGNGAGGSILFQVAPAGSTGSSQNALVTHFTVAGTGGIRIGSAGSGASPYLFPVTGASTSLAAGGLGLCLYSYAIGASSEVCALSLGGNAYTGTSGSGRHVYVGRTFSPTSGTATFATVELAPIINQTGGANGITRGLYVNPTLTAAADFRALEISDGNVVLPKTVTAGGTTGAQTINKVTGSVNFAAAATSLVVTNSYVTTSSIIIATVATNDTTMKSVAVVAGAGSFTIYANAAATAETRVNFHVSN